MQLEEREQEVRALQEEQQEERRYREEERRTLDEERRRKKEEIHQDLQRSQQQEALQLSQAKAELQLMAERNAELQEEVCVYSNVLTKIRKTERLMLYM